MNTDNNVQPRQYLYLVYVAVASEQYANNKWKCQSR